MLIFNKNFQRQSPNFKLQEIDAKFRTYCKDTKTIFCLLTLTRAPITPRLVNLKYSNDLVFDEVCRNGYRNNGTCANKNCDLVSECDATH